ncbi:MULTISPECIES: DUF3761 domain-containing protein [unclassified Streptomyces]|uniref:DUF3761 domain-containing protein n=1 Tax=unclassified Streptomyces TaxID=2593676 RepID=UPI00331E9C65
MVDGGLRDIGDGGVVVHGVPAAGGGLAAVGLVLDVLAVTGDYVRHTTGTCGWTHRQKPRDTYETAKCKDAALSYSRHSQGTCSHHHGVRHWFE